MGSLSLLRFLPFLQSDQERLLSPIPTRSAIDSIFSVIDYHMLRLVSVWRYLLRDYL